MENTDSLAVPTHLGLIVDGNRRWAREHGVTIAQGHRRGYQNLKTLCKAGLKYGIRYFSAFVFSTENWQRDQQEVRDLMKLLRWVLKHELQEFHREGFRIRVIGSKAKLGASLITAIHDAEKLTENNTRGTLLLCLDYGGQQELVEATKQIAASGVAPEEITAEMISEHLYAPDVPPLDLIIRTSGEQRLSNFMLWESAYSELAFAPQYFPDFDEKALDGILADYAKRNRRFGS
ncbi:MAG TPA: polyprenyl diphosphate synthase [Candidatus Saccharimonadales bacterium]|nr:polyprenyl diphosphate synthase [Candidatus Saccharimonadales bacterium]